MGTFPPELPLSREARPGGSPVRSGRAGPAQAPESEARLRYDPRDSGDLTEEALLIRRLFEISESARSGFEIQVQMLLRLGMGLFDLEIGVLSQVTGDRYEVVQALHPDSFPLAVGDTFDLAQTFCVEPIQAAAPVGFERASVEVPDHPAYHRTRLEAYIGVPVRVEDEIFGTLSFASPRPRPGPFRPRDVEWLQLMASWVGNELARRRLVGRLERQSRTDPLTELLNRRGLENHLQRTRARSQDPLAAILIDLDDFKAVNETYGLATGDEVLRLVADALHRTVRADDPCARIGGDEFMVITRADVAARVAERIRSAIEQLAPVYESRQIPISASISVFPIGRGGPVTEMLKQAQPGLTEAKRHGKNRVVELLPPRLQS